MNLLDVLRRRIRNEMKTTHAKKPRRGSLSGEAHIAKKLAASLCDAQTEVPTPVGRIDILTPVEIIEVKSVRLWKHGVGQLLAYQQSFPSRKLRLHLFGLSVRGLLPEIRKHCSKLAITVTYER